MNNEDEKTLQNIIDIQFNKMNNILETLTSKIDIINKRVILIEKKISEEIIYSPDIKPLINEKIDFQNKDMLFKYLCANNISNDMKIIKEYYLIKYEDGERINLICPIKFESYRKFYYWNGQKWIADMDGYYISKTLADNLQRLYLRNNNIKGSTDKMEKIFENQQYINSMKTDKYKRLLIKELRTMINCL